MKRFEKRMKEIREEILEMHNLAKRSVEICIEALAGDVEMKRELSMIERQTDVLDTDINFDCTSLIALFQPVAKDLRFALSMMKISSAYERIADLAQEIGMYEIEIPYEFHEIQKTILKMFDVVKLALDGNVESLKRKLTELDDRVDNIYSEFIINFSKTKCEVDRIEEIVDTVLIARHLERIGDLLTKIGARIIFVERGSRVWIK